MPAPSDAVIDQMTAGFQDAAKTASTSALKSEAAKRREEGEAFLGVHLAERDGQAEQLRQATAEEGGVHRRTSTKLRPSTKARPANLVTGVRAESAVVKGLEGLMSSTSLVCFHSYGCTHHHLLGGRQSRMLSSSSQIGATSVDSVEFFLKATSHDGSSN
eukprot:COSAG01_NODE_33549_length_562_cov_1.112311_1_plen_159_part_10